MQDVPQCSVLVCGHHVNGTADPQTTSIRSSSKFSFDNSHGLHVLRSPYEAPLDATKYACWIAVHHLLTMSTVQPLHGLHVIRTPYEAPLHKTRMLTLYAAPFIFLQQCLPSMLLHLSLYSRLLLHSSYITYCLLYTSPSPRDKRQSRMPSSA